MFWKEIGRVGKLLKDKHVSVKDVGVVLELKIFKVITKFYVFQGLLSYKKKKQLNEK